ncbi:protein SAWADEE HOMEODOMAIN HOMOLOG 1-like [Hibiscus syriacus]|uniref:protein SAWADEE HOMEODOMAIN HOMOLOG 1-like n=1 Tax=Hibiscus syriacus TaxID=106335 RepID=UPI0019228A7D|nr:protein SAWADEE HOMEODOMAIN HOMOLOG 1-like [Hibiscus syriacus]
MEDNDPWDSLSHFTLAEVLQMENNYKAKGNETLNEEFCKKLATNFSSSSTRLGKSTVTWQQVQHFFREKQLEKQSEQDSSALAIELFVDLSDANSSKPLEFMQRRKGTAEDLKELSFEARSSKDYAWYDVETFLNYRVLYNGELEVRVRFSGFDKAEDEWVNVETAVRERSIPLEPSECDLVKIGDLVLCYLDREYYQLYCDAHVMDVRRQTHDAKSCTCVFVVCYDHDYSEENVSLERLCRRPVI